MKPRTASEAPRFERFRVVRELGRGAQGAVLEALDLERDVRVAIKTLRDVGADEIARIKSEFRAVRDLRHPSLVRLGELVEERGKWFFTMELVEGTDFLSYVREEAGPPDTTSWPTHSATRVDRRSYSERPPAPSAPVNAADRPLASFDESRLRSVLAQLASALECLHGASKVHRDSKPSNVLVETTGRAVLIDFGVVGELGAEDMMQVVGTVAYMAPEQASGDAVGPAADWYAVGVILFEAITGRRPFEGASRDVMEQKCTREAPRPSDLVRAVPVDLERLCVRLLARDPADRATGDDVARTVGVVSVRGDRAEVGFVGRAEELAALARAFDDVGRGQAVSVTLEGESGVGKSALARRFVDDLRGRTRSRALVLVGRCHEHESVPYNAFDAVIDALARHIGGRKEATRAELLPPHMDRVRTLFPTVGLALDDGELEPSRTAGTLVERDEAFHALRELFRRVATQWPLVVVLEDVQWADAESLALLAALTEPPDAPSMLLVATARTSAGAPPPAVSVLHGDVRRVSLGGLGAADASALVLGLLAHAEGRGLIDPEAIVESAHGHPMFIEELVRYLARPREKRGALVLDDALRARVAELGEEARAVLAVVAAAGVPTTQEVIAAAAHVPFATYCDAVVVLHDAKLVRARGARPDDPIEPFHDRVREAVYAGLDRPTRAAIHGSLARALESRLAGPELLFHHFAAAGEAARATEYAERAADAASRALAFDRAAELCRSALALGAGDLAHRRRLLTTLGERLVDAGRSKEAAQAFLDASTTGKPTRDERLDLVRRAAERFLMSGHIEEGLDATAVALDAAGLTMPTTRLGALARLGWYHFRVSRVALEWTAKRPEDVDPAAAMRMDLCWSVGAGLGLIDSVRSILFITRGVLECVQHGDDARIARALAGAAVGDAGLLRREATARLGVACRRAAAADGSDRSKFYVALVDMTQHFFLENDWPKTLAAGREAERLWLSTGRTEGWEVDIVDQFACWSLDNAGRFTELGERAPAKIRAAQRSGNRFVEVNFRTEFVNLRLVEDRPKEARRDVEDAIAAWPKVGTDFGNQHYLALRGLTSVALYERDEHAAAALLPQWRRYFASLLGRVPFLRMDALWNVGAIALVRGEAARSRGEVSVAAARLREARRAQDEAAGIDLPYARANATQLTIGIAAFEGDALLLERTLREGIGDADTRGAELHAAAMRIRLAALVGGAEGDELAKRGGAWMARERVRDPERLLATVLPATGRSP